MIQKLNVFVVIFIFLIIGKPITATVSLDNISQVVVDFNKFAEDSFEKSEVPGVAIAIVYQNQVKYLKCFGVRKKGFTQPIDVDTVFQIASCSKAFTAALIASLVGEGLVGWDDQVINYYPEFRLFDPYVTSQLTIRDLLSHRNGLPSFIGDNLEDNFLYSTKEILYRLRFQKPVSGFRSKYAYQNYDVTAAGETVVKLTGKKWSKLISERIFKPLNMNSSCAAFADFTKEENKALPHSLKNGKFSLHSLHNSDTQAPAASISSSIQDMIKWVKMQLNEGMYDGKRIINAKALQETHKSQIVINSLEDEIDTYGLCWDVLYKSGQKIVTHEGAFESGINSLVCLIPSLEAGLIVLTNGYPCGLTTALGKTFQDLFIKGHCEVDWWPIMNEKISKAMKDLLEPDHPLLNPPSKKTPSLPLTAYEGEYQNSFFGKIQIIQKNDYLFLYLGNNKIPHQLTHWDRDIFKDENQSTGVCFTVGEKNQTTQVLLDAFNYDGRDGLFQRIGK